jgi:hypothetical protein
VSSEAKYFHEGFFARIIRDALCTLPDATGERQPLAFEQQLHAVVEHSESATSAISPSNIPAKTPAQTMDVHALKPVLQHSSRQDFPQQVPAARKISKAEVQASPPANQYSAVIPATETSALESAPGADKTATSFPRNTRAMAALPPVKKAPLAITMRDSRTAETPTQNHTFTTTVVHKKSIQASVQAFTAKSPAADVLPAAVTDNPGLIRVERAEPDSNRETLQVAPPVIAEPAPVIAGHRLPERKTAPPALRIGAVTIRVVDAAPTQAASNRAVQSATTPVSPDSIASAESRHFLRTF